MRDNETGVSSLKSTSVSRAVRRKLDGSSGEKRTAGSGGRMKTVFSGICSDVAGAVLLVLRLTVSVLLDASIAILAGCVGIPMTNMGVFSMVSVNQEATMVDILFTYGLPCLFFTGLWAAFAVWAIRKTNRGVSGLFEKVRKIGKGQKVEPDGPECEA